MRNRYYCWPPTLFLGPAVVHHFLNSRTVTDKCHATGEASTVEVCLWPTAQASGFAVPAD